MPQLWLPTASDPSPKPGAGLDSAAEANHRIANDLALIAGLIRFQAANLPPTPTIATAEVRRLLQEMSGRIDAVGPLHRLLMSSDDSTLIDLAAYLQEIAEAAVSSLASSGQTKLSFDLIPDCVISAKRGVTVGLLVGEAIANALKYAHPTGVAGKIHVASRRLEDGGLIIEIADDGVGLPDDFDAATDGGAGLTLMRGLADQLAGRIEFEQRPIGLCVRVRLAPRGFP